MLERSSGPDPYTSLGEGRTESLRSASRAKQVVSRSGRGEGSFLEVGRRADKLNDVVGSFPDAMVEFWSPVISRRYLLRVSVSINITCYHANMENGKMPTSSSAPKIDTDNT